MPGSTIKMVVQRVKVDSLPHFKRPLIRLDGCFLKGSFKNEFLTAVRRDANNQMFPIAWVVVEVECTDSWGFEIVISDILPRVEHRNCARHVFANWSGKKAFLETTCKSDIVDNNLCEAFNSSIVEARFKSIIRMLEDIRTKMMTRIQDAQPPKQKGKSSIKRSTTLDKSKGKTTMSIMIASFQDGSGQTSSTPKSQNIK
ncbi:hypothetical protein Godav_029033 [Gossypium davidsonii]|uniref:MULE transposase domain-containing protein n=1 Tax=Gossypium davidsonii TaxID=34287 RepID=A0A7J8TG91_GOSDV|nr:hypothetical protein [Gossypium davidsonii]